MTSSIDWQELEVSDNGVKFLKLKEGSNVRIRPLHKPVIFYKYFHKYNGKWKSAITENPSTCPIKSRHPELKEATLRYACYVIDRSDGEIKVTVILGGTYPVEYT